MVLHRLVVLGGLGSVHSASGVFDGCKKGETFVSITVGRCSYRVGSVSLTRNPVLPPATLLMISTDRFQSANVYVVICSKLCVVRG